MVNIEIVVVGKNKDEWLTEGIIHFEKMLKRYCKLQRTTIPAPKLSSSLSPAQIKIEEAGLIEKHIKSGTIIALSDSGKKYDSQSFAKTLEKILAQSIGNLKFLIGGPRGLHDSIIQRANHVISLSPLTFSHQIARLVLLEQLYRAFSILNNTDYHK